MAASSFPAAISFWAIAFISSRDEHCSWLQVPTGKLHPPHWQISPSAMDFTVGLEPPPRALATASAAAMKAPMIVALRILPQGAGWSPALHRVSLPRLLLPDFHGFFLSQPDLGHFALHAAGDERQQRTQHN